MIGIVGQRSRHLDAFLSCTLHASSSLSNLRGQEHVLRVIWTLACEEWWNLHIERFPLKYGFPDLTLPRKRRTIPDNEDDVDELFEGRQEDDQRFYPRERQQIAGCPVATIARNIAFPSPAVVPLGTFNNQESEHLYVNMMPFDALKIDTLPECCKGYWSMIVACIKMCDRVRVEVAYLTIDERPTPPDSSQRRPGLHVESPGVLPVPPEMEQADSSPFRVELPGGRYVPGAEHYWGNGMMMRNECVRGGVFMGSNVAGTTAVWNCHINNEYGQFVGPHGDIEALRPLLGPCTRTLDAGELIWMTDRTPHESLPVPLVDGMPVRRQYFRLVVGTVSAWFAHHSTPNPLGFRPDPSVRIVQGNKFDLLGEVRCHRNWHCGTAEQLQAARDFSVLREQLCWYGLGHLVKRFHEYGITSIARLCQLDADQQRIKAEADRKGVYWVPQWGKGLSRTGTMVLFEEDGAHYYDELQMKKVVAACHRLNGSLPALAK